MKRFTQTSSKIAASEEAAPRMGGLRATDMPLWVSVRWRRDPLKILSEMG